VPYTCPLFDITKVCPSLHPRWLRSARASLTHYAGVLVPTQGLEDPTYVFGGDGDMLFDENYEEHDVVRVSRVFAQR
jgi:hypothetical protein